MTTTTTPFADNGLTVVDRTDRATIFELSGGRRLAVIHPPHATTAPKGAALVRTALNILQSVDSVRRTASADKTLSELGRSERVKPVQAAARTALAEVHADLATFAGEVAGLEKSVYAPPALDPADAVGAMVDLELRSWIRALKGEQRAKALDNLAKEPRMLEAVVRSPTKLGEFSEFSGTLWRERVEATHPQAPALARQQEALAYVTNLLPHFDNVIG
ncbi:hypothetical protein [Phenylobacterium sp.]|uniref:hypothetical protein n=1 Tax=Phenylobacterium sp. TaxID=1871053 RepID=UPI00374CEBBC